MDLRLRMIRDSSKKRAFYIRGQYAFLQEKALASWKHSNLNIPSALRLPDRVSLGNRQPDRGFCHRLHILQASGSQFFPRVEC